MHCRMQMYTNVGEEGVKVVEVGICAVARGGVEGRHLNHKEVQMLFGLPATQYVGPQIPLFQRLVPPPERKA